jgi:hypothetical protein
MSSEHPDKTPRGRGRPRKKIAQAFTVTCVISETREPIQRQVVIEMLARLAVQAALKEQEERE